jgi:hypothetical protein
MRGFKIAAAGIGILIALIVGWAVVGFVLHAVEFIVIAASRSRTTAGGCPGLTSSRSPPTRRPARARRTSTRSWPG